MSSLRRALAAVAGVAVTAAGLQIFAVSPAHASSAPYADLLISEVYGGDGSANATYHHDFIELYNPTSSAITVAANSLYLSYIGATSTSTPAPVAVPAATIPAYTHYLLERATAGSGATPVNQDPPHVDAQIAINDIAGAGGRIYLQTASTGQVLTGDVTANATILDATSSTGSLSYEGAAGSVAGSAILSLQRKDDATYGYVDTNSNSNDLKNGTPTPKGTADGPLVGAPSPLSVTTPTTGLTARTGTPYSLQLVASGGTGTKVFALADGSSALPDGLSLGSTGLISGTPATAGTVSGITVKVTAGAETATTASFALTINELTPANHVVISEFWGDGGYTNAPFTRSFVELYNPTNTDVDLSTWSLAWMNASNSDTVSTTYQSNLTGTIKAGGYHLIGGSADASAFGIDLPSVDDEWTPAVNWDYRDGSLALLNTQAPVALTKTSAGAQDAHVVDLLGYGPTSGFKPVAYETAVTGTMTGLTVGAYRVPVYADTDNNAADFQTGEALTPTNAAGDTATPELPPAVPTTCADGFDKGSTSSPVAIATIQGTTDVSAGAACDVVTEGVVTGIYSAGYTDAGAASCGLCGFYIQTDGSYGGQTDATPGRSDAIFVSAGTGFRGSYTTSSGTSPLALGDRIQVKGKVGEVRDTGKEYRTQIVTATTTAGNVTKVGTGAVTAQAALPATYADREAHEGELFKPTDVVITDTYNFETSGELGLASGGTPLQQPGQVARDGDPSGIAAAQKDVKDRGYFLWGGTNYLSAGIYKSSTSKNSDVPYPFISAAGAAEEHTARTGASVTYPAGGVLDFRNGKWYLDAPRSVVATCTVTGSGSSLTHTNCTPDYGTGAIAIENTRTTNQEPAAPAAGSNIRFATYNVENFFSVTMEDFAKANTLYTCEYDDDRQGNHVLAYQCTNPAGMATAWDPVTGAVTAYSSALASAPRGAARQADLGRQTEKIVTAINKLGADVVALEEIGNPNKLKLGVTNDPLHPDVNNTKDQGQGTAIQWRDETLSYLVDHLNAELGPDDDQWAFAASPEETTDATSVPGLCATVQPNGKPVDGPAHLAGTCSYSSGQDVIRSAFIYKKKKVIPVGSGDLDLPGYTVNGTPDPWGNHVFKDASGKATSSPFDNAREPFAQYFKPVGAKNNEGFALIVNHFKSKGDAAAPSGPAVGGDKNSGLHGAFNASRVAQAKELVRFANEFAKKWDTDNVFLLGDFNAYSGEDPIHAITEAAADDSTGNADGVSDALDFEEIHSDDPNDTSYVFTTKVNGISYGGAGSLDHILASTGARGLDPHTDIWEINANEPDLYNYSRFNTNATTYFDGSTPFRGSDHNPEVIDLTLPSAAAAKKVTDVQILGINDFHGRLLADASDGGAAPLAGAVTSLRGVYGADQTILASAGDNVGASIFESFTSEDKPALDALNKMNLQVSSVGNHEFDHGLGKFFNQIQKKKSDTNPYGADEALTWGDYLAANVVWKADGTGPDGTTHKAGDPISDPTRVIEVPNPLNPAKKIKIGFVGTVTSDLPSLQSPENLAGVTVLDGTATNAKINEYADQLKADGANLVILLTHEGAANTDCSAMSTAGTAFSKIINGVDANVDAILSGHTHLEYSCTNFTKPATDSNPLTVRPVMQGSSYGMALDQLVYSFDADNKPVDLIANNVGVKGPNGALFSYAEHAASDGGPGPVQQIVDKAVADSEAAGAVVLGTMTAPMYRSKLTDGTDNRGGESVLGNQIAEIQQQQTSDAQHGGAQIAFMNPGGLRADAIGVANGGLFDLTYRQAADVQPFANELVNMKLTGAQIKKVLEEQWQRDAAGNIPARPFLKLGVSDGFSYTYTEAQDPKKPTGAKLGTVTGMWLDGAPIDLATVYSVTVNSFLATGGDNFWELNNGAGKLDTELSDLQAQVEYMESLDGAPLQVDASQRSIKVEGAARKYRAGDQVSLTLGSLDMNGGTTEHPAVKDDMVSIKVGDTVLKSGIAVAHGNDTATPDDHWGTASVTFTVPQDTPFGQLHLVGATTGTDVLLPSSIVPTTPGLAINAIPAQAWTAGTAVTPLTVSAVAGTGSAPYSYTATGLPAGVTLSSGGVLSGTPVAAASGTATVTVTDDDATTVSTQLAWTVGQPSSGTGGSTPPPVGTPGNPAPVVGASMPAKIKAKVKRITLAFSVRGASPTVVNGKVIVYDGRKKIGTFTVKNGKVVIKFKKKLKKGKHKLRIVLGASATSKSATIRKTLKVT